MAQLSYSAPILINVLALLLLNLSYVDCISGGGDSVIRRHPWQLSLQYDGSHICGAVLIGAKWALTAAKCVDHRSTRLSVRAGSDFADRDGKVFKVKKVHIHYKYNKITSDADLALLEFAQNIEDSENKITRATLSSRPQLPDGQSINLTGWGAKDVNDTISNVLQFARIYVVDKNDFQEFYPSNHTKSSRLYGVSYGIKSNITACRGDFGGPCISMARVHGIVSSAGPCGEARWPVVCTRTFPYNKWIYDVTGIAPYHLNCSDCKLTHQINWSFLDL